MKKLLAYFLALLVCLTGVAALSEEQLNAAQSVAAETQTVYDELVVGTTTALTGGFFTDMWGSNASDIDVRMLLHAYNLMEWNADKSIFDIDNTVVSGIAVTERYSGERTYTIALYDDLMYSDGTPITAYDYAFSILLRSAPEVAAIGGNISASDCIYGMAEYKSGESKALTGVHIINDHLFSITISAEYLPFFYEMALLDCNPYPISVIAPGCEVADDGEGVYIRNIKSEEDQATEMAARAEAIETGVEYIPVEETPVFTAELLQKTILDPATGYMAHPSVVSGPYILTSYDSVAGVAEFAINPYYKGNSAGVQPSIPKIIFRTVSSDNMMAELENGNVDLLHKVVKADVLDAGMQLINDSEGRFTIANYPRSGHSFISYSCERPVMQSERVRQAIAHCFDKESFVADYVRNYGVSVDSYYGIGQWMYELVEGSLAAPISAPAENATEEEIAAYEETVAAWNALSLENVKTYAFDLEAAEALLKSDGWDFDATGASYNPEEDEVRYAWLNEQLTPLELSIIYPEGNAVGAYLEGEFTDNLAQLGIKLTVEAKPFAELLQIYSRQQERNVDMIYLATNFAYVFDPSATFNPEDTYQGVVNRTAINDRQLYELAVDMRKTEPGDVLSYCQKWVKLQEYYSEVLPALPIYSNVYFDFYTSNLQDYAISADVSWAKAIVNAYMGDVMEEKVVQDADFEIID